MNDCDALGPFHPMWINAEPTETYIATEPIKDTDEAYTNDITGIEVAQRDIILHGFSLTEDEKIMLSMSSVYMLIALPTPNGCGRFKGTMKRLSFSHRVPTS